MSVGGTSWSGGHAADVPVHASATSQSPLAARQTVPAVTSPSAGHPTDVPVHVSATSHAPADARHTAPAGANASAGQAGEQRGQLRTQAREQRSGVSTEEGHAE